MCNCLPMLKTFCGRVARTGKLRLLFIFVLIILLMGGNATQIIMLNWWFLQFPSSPGNYTMFAVSGFVFSAFFVVLLILYMIIYRPDLRFARQALGWKYLTFAGWLDTLNSALAVYAAAHTPPVLQATFTALVPLYAAFFTKTILKDKYRSYNNRYIRSSFALLSAGVLVATIANLTMKTSSSTEDSSASENSDSGNGSWNNRGDDSPMEVRIWSLLFALSVPVVVLLNVVQTLYMTRYTHDPEFLAYVAQLYMEEGHPNSGGREEQVKHILQHRQRGGATSQPYLSHHYKVMAERIEREEREDYNDDHHEYREEDQQEVTPLVPLFQPDQPRGAEIIHGDDTAVKLVMLAGETVLQCLFTLLWLPMDALPWYGGSRSVAEAFLHFKDGLRCVWYCPNNLQCCIGYSAGFVGVYVGAAYLNQYSVTLCSMVSQLSGPVTALLLVLVPALNVEEQLAPWWVSVLSVLLMTVGTFIYVMWESLTEKEKVRGELDLKLKMYGLKERVEQTEIVTEE
ncbi:hypothetical protein AGDE_11921 [Angomonas deanei]|uniref:EamA-like transporter family n=1 Tax=Angomonas deanei TaxID=59799 RepID=A0A7G2CS54_9TRYP|nr:hypothetical protein AGDE_11921 [Angomonas deanei]CAD2222658.1 hypothetical protein, conserved [Angomonas deanei]|eukprot:EPY25287.1 hypothetical protein AGDE_11921 [Angomonas deanei]